MFAVLAPCDSGEHLHGLLDTVAADGAQRRRLLQHIISAGPAVGAARSQDLCLRRVGQGANPRGYASTWAPARGTLAVLRQHRQGTPTHTRAPRMLARQPHRQSTRWPQGTSSTLRDSSRHTTHSLRLLPLLPTWPPLPLPLAAGSVCAGWGCTAGSAGAAALPTMFG